jgi:uncharacterized protein YutE (UPF0331/DUF86 family)/predicted nucleotidyltransferase
MSGCCGWQGEFGGLEPSFFLAFSVNVLYICLIFQEGGGCLRVQRPQSLLVEKEGILVARGGAFSDLSDLVRHAMDTIEKTGESKGRAGVQQAEVVERLDALASALARDGVRLAYLFGSILQDSHARDVDVAVLFGDYSFEQYLETLELTCRTLETRRVDVVVLNRANVPLKLRALLEGKRVFTATPSVPIDVVMETLFEYDDYRWFMAEYRLRLSRRCEEGLSMAERRVDRERVEGLLSTLDEAVADLRRLRGRFASFEQFHSAVDTRELCVHYLRIALEAVLNICRHFLAVAGVSLTELDTTNLIELAGEKGLLEPTFAHRIRGMAGMRNAIVHVYWRLDYHAIHRAVTEQLADLDEFARQVRTYVDTAS